MNKNPNHFPYRFIFIALSACYIFACLCLFVLLNTVFEQAAVWSGTDFAGIKQQLRISQYFIIAVMLGAFGLLLFLLLTFSSYIKSRHKIVEAEARITDERLKELERQKSYLQEQSIIYKNIGESEKQMAEFFSSMAHELKTPVSVILGTVQLMQQKAQADGSNGASFGDKHLKALKQNSYRLVRLVNNILDITRLDAGYIKFNPVNCNIVFLIDEIVQSVAPFAQNKGISLVFDTETEEITTAVDMEKMERIILNLLSNAIKFSKPGGVVNVNVGMERGNIRISVRDNGAGIPAELQQAIFERYRQVNSSLTRQAEGSGIGLSLVKSFVELHNGRISVRSEVNKGSEFIVELPVTSIDEKVSEGETAPDTTSSNRIIEAVNIELSDIYTVA